MKNRCLPRAGRRAAALLTSLVLMLTLLPTAALAAEDVAVSPKNFPDENFRAYVTDELDKNSDGTLSADEIAAVTEIGCDERSIASLEGIGYFTNLETLYCQDNLLTALDVSRNTKLTKLNCSSNHLTVLNVSANTALTELSCGSNQLTALDLSGAPNLDTLICGGNQLTELNVRANPALTTLRCISNCLTELDVSRNTKLETLVCSGNQLTVLDLSVNTALTELSCSNNRLTSLDLSRTKVTSYDALSCSSNQYTLGLKDGEYTFDLTTLPGSFDVSKVGSALNMSGGEITGNILTVKPGAEMVRYKYACRDGLWADFAWKVHADTVRKIGLTQTESYTFPELTAGYTSVSSNKFLIRNTGNVATGPLKVVLEGKNADAFLLASQDGTLSADGSIAIRSIGLIGTAPTVSFQPAPGLSAGTYTAKLVVKSADDDGAALSESFGVSVTVKPGVVNYALDYDTVDGLFRKKSFAKESWDGEVWTEQADRWKALDRDGDGYYETLRLEGFHLNCAPASRSSMDLVDYGVWLQDSRRDDFLTLEVIGDDNVITCDAGGNTLANGALNSSKLVITGGGTLRIRGENASIATALDVNNLLSVEGNTKLILETASVSSDSQEASRALTVNGSEGVRVEKGSSIEISALKGDSTPGTAISSTAARRITAEDSIVTGAAEVFLSGLTGTLTQKDAGAPLVIRDRTEAERTTRSIHYSWATGQLGEMYFDDLSTHSLLTFTSGSQQETIEQLRMKGPATLSLRSGDAVTVSVDPAAGYTLTGWTVVAGDTYEDYTSAEKYAIDTTEPLRLIIPDSNLYAVIPHFDINENARVAVRAYGSGQTAQSLVCYLGYGRMDQSFTLPTALEAGLYAHGTSTPQRFLYWYLGTDTNTQYHPGDTIPLTRSQLDTDENGELGRLVNAKTQDDSARNYLSVQTEGQGSYQITCTDRSVMGGISLNNFAVPMGANVTLTPVPEEGWCFKEWKIIRGDVTVKDGSFTMPDTAVSVTAVFEADAGYERPVTIQTDGGGTASASPDRAAAGAKITLTAVPDKGYSFKEWQVISGGVTVEDNSFIMPAAPVTVKAVFEPILKISAENFPDPAFLQYINECYMDTDKDGYLSAGELAKIRTINIPGKGVRDLTGLAHFTALEKLFCQSNGLTVLDLSGNPALTFVNCSQNRLTSLNFGSNPKLASFYADGSIYRITLTEAGTFDLSTLPEGFDVSKTGSWTGGSVSGTILSVEEDAAFVTYTYDPGSGLEPVLFTLLVTGREAEPIPINETTFPDASFRESVKSEIDRNGDGKLSTDEILPIRELDAKYDLSLRPNLEGLTDLTGIEYFTELESLTCKDYQLTSLDLSRNTKLKQLDVSGNEYRILLTEAGTFDLSGLPGKFDVSKASGWTGGTVSGTVLTVEEGAQEITYTYDCGGGFTACLTLKVRYPGVKIAAPVISPAGGIYNGPVTVSITCATPDASIYYLDGNGYKLYYRGPFVLDESARITAWAEDENGDMEDSERVTATFSIVEAGHVHDYSQDWAADSTGHWHACQCLQQADFAPHTFQWIIDREATRTETGAKHEKCSVCGFIQSEGTVIDKLPGGGSSGGCSSSGSSSAATYPVSAPSASTGASTGTAVTGGSVNISTKNASAGDTVTVTVSPEAGYRLGKLTVVDKNGKEIPVTLKDGKYTFTMPASQVDIKPVFEKIPAETAETAFPDVPSSAYYAEPVKWAAEKGITSGTKDGGFAPGNTCTRAQIVTFLWRAAGSPEPQTAETGMTDVSPAAYYAKAVAWAIENGITVGRSDGSFNPNGTCTRANGVTFLYRAAKAAASGNDAGFNDVAADAYYAAAVQWALENGITNGQSNGLFGPNGGCTRAQIVTFLFRMHQGR